MATVTGTDILRVDSADIEASDPDEFDRPRIADQRTKVFIDLMVAKEFVRGKTVKIYAKKWGISKNAAERYAIDAAKFLRLIQEPEAVRRRVLQRLHEISAEDKPDRVPALINAAKMVGVLDPPPGSVKSRAETIAYLVQSLEDPDDELLEAMRIAKKTIYRLLFAAKKDLEE
jgi:hypothetical protein